MKTMNQLTSMIDFLTYLRESISGNALALDDSKVGYSFLEDNVIQIDCTKPYGWSYDEYHNSDMVLVAGGIHLTAQNDLSHWTLESTTQEVFDDDDVSYRDIWRVDFNGSTFFVDLLY